ncbi:MAG: D-alanyl-D-alanine carboxypeptidase [Rubrivivax sp.]|nr:D-alanyl-D-alanine carboxypeptidase [Rubrivivax sp.]
MSDSARRWFVAALLGAALHAHAAGPAAPAAVIGSLPRDVQRALAGSGLPLASFGLYVQPVDGRDPVATLNAESPYVLASTAKIVTSLAALDLLGPQYRWRTHAYATGPVYLGRLQGDLIIAGGGNARLSSAELLGWMRRMREQGLAEIGGDILIDRSAFALTDEDHRHTPVPGAGRPHHVWPGALTLDEGVLHVRLQSRSDGPRQPAADVQTVPPLDGVPMLVKVSSGNACSAQARWTAGNGAPAQLVVEGRWAPRCGARDLMLVAPPEVDVMPNAVVGLWREAGGVLHGRVREIDLSRRSRDGDRLPVPEAGGEPLSPWSTHVSEPLPVLLRDMNKRSNNLAARHLMLSMARGFPLKPASLPAAQSRVLGWLERQGLAAGDLTLENGSGLSREERGKPRALVQLLLNAWRSREWPTFIDSLPVAGVDGTLQHRLQRGLAAGRAYLKTGTLLDTRALAGYVQGASGRLYAVAALVNHPEAARGTPALDALIEWVARNG